MAFSGYLVKGVPMSADVTRRIPVLCATGGGCSGKTKIIEFLQELYGDLIYVIPEAATWLIERGVRPPGGEHATVDEVLPFQRLVYAKIQWQEQQAFARARAQGAKLIIADRGRLDGAAFIASEDRLNIFAKEVSRGGISADLFVYDTVIHLGSAVRISAELYEELDAADTDTERFEGPEQALIRCQDIGEVWRGHVNYKYIPPCPDGPDGIQPKIDAFHAIARELMARG